MRKVIKISIIATIFIGCLFYSTAIEVKAEALFFQLRESSSANWIDNGVVKGLPDPSSELGIPSGGTVRINISLAATKGDLDTFVSLKLFDGLSFVEYYVGVMTINNQLATATQYNQYLSGGMPLRLTQSDVVITIDLQSQGNIKNRISTNLFVSAPSITQGSNTNTSEHAFYGKFNQQKIHTINFYDGQSLIESQQVLDYQLASPFVLSKEGHAFLGFNTRQDGSGIYIEQQPITQSLNVYAIYKIHQFNIQYIVDDEVLVNRIVNYGDTAVVPKPPDKKNNKFVRWDKEAIHVTQDMQIYAIYEKDEEQQKSKGIKMIDSSKGSGGVERFKDIVIQLNKKGIPKVEDGVKKVYRVNTSTRFNYLALVPITLVCIVIGAGIYKKRKK